MLHHIQKNILDTLATSETVRYGALKPTDLDGNVFGYHLKSLLRDKYVIKLEDGSYELTRLGKDYIVNRYENPLLQAHSILLIIVRRGDQWLMRERLVQPLLGMAGFIHGEPIAGEDVIGTARQRLLDKTGIDITLELHGSGLITIKRSGVIESYSHAIVVYGETNQDITITNDATGRNFWLPDSELTNSTILPSSIDIISQISQSTNKPFDLTYALNHINA